MSIDLAHLVERLSGARVGCIGDVMLDRYVYGTVDRISPEAPIPVLRAVRESVSVGGAGNVLANLLAIGVNAWFVSVIGDDEAGRAVAGLLGAHPRARVDLVTDARPTTLKVRFIGAHQQMLRVDTETTAPLAASTGARVLAAVERLLPECDSLVLSDYAKGVLTPAVTRACIERGRAAGRPVIVDPKQRDFGIYRGATLITPNRKELHEATGMTVGTDSEVETAATGLATRHGLGAMLVTRSEQGATLVRPGLPAVHIPTVAREVYDVSGAGDTVVAVLAGGFAAGLDPEPAARLANVAAGIVVGKAGTATASGEELYHELVRARARAPERKVLTPAEARGLVAAWRQRGERIAFTNGCFDLLHPGHIGVLAGARATSDRLVVGLNSDASVRRLKGPERPIQDEIARATVLASLADVDAVVVFDEDTPIELIRLLAPDVLAKGADYREDQVVGADIVRAGGGRVHLVPLQPGQSTTGIVGRISGAGRS